MNILIPTAGNRSVLINAFREQGSVAKVVTTEIDPLAPGSFFADKCYRVPRSSEPDFLDVLEKICAQENIDLLIPLADLDLVRFAAERERFSQLGVKVLAAPTETIELASDKLKTYELFCRLDIPTPKTLTLEEIQHNSGAMPFPVYLKPRYISMKNSASYFFDLVEDPETLDYYCQKLKGQTKDYLVQTPLLGGKEINVDFFVHDQQLKRLVTLYRLKAGDGGGIIRGQTIPCHPKVKTIIETLVKHVDFYGSANIQLFEFPNGQLLVTEINPRFSNSSALVVRPAGVDFFELTIKMLQDESISSQFDNYNLVSVTSSYQPRVVEKSCFVNDVS